MRKRSEIDDLTSGLRALAILARHAPLDLGAFALLNGLMPTDAAALISVFEDQGFAARIRRGRLFVPTGLTLRVVARDNSAWLH